MFSDGVRPALAPELLPGWVLGEGRYLGAVCISGYQPAHWCTHRCSAAEPSVLVQSWCWVMGMVAPSHLSKAFRCVDAEN